ncbi:MAG: hypothetical protein ACRD1H_00130 [Vicinamibacterales bacterium]
MMPIYDFRLVLDQTDISEAEADTIYGRCKDGTLISSGEVTFMDFDRDAATLDDAVQSAIRDVNAAGFRVARVEIEADQLVAQP